MPENPENPENPEKPENPERFEKREVSEGAPSAESPRGPESSDSESGRTPLSSPGPQVSQTSGQGEEAGESAEAADVSAASDGAGPSGRRRLAAALWPPRVTRAQLIVALLLFVLGLGLAIQVSSTSENSALRGARQEDLVRILDELDDRTQRLEDEKARLEKQRSELESSSDQAEEARKQTQEKERQLGILAGTVAAEGPGITLSVGDPTGAVESDMLLDAIQELRAAGAEAIQVNGVRVVADSYFTGSGDDMRIDGTKVAAPYVFKVIGKPEDLEPALNIPGGVVQTLEKEQATATVERAPKIVVDALRPAKRPDYAQSSSQ
ncbi:DUF881 domain-containing protein [Streptomyces sp. WAC01280]|uniref:DUF881 domain-containing protein n=1 Tax=Streptomyces sp. WAC01280 TaxID=2487424 RepID=UPI0021AFC632|nr:DUF881 domain-containing protein [Streptomyces sp. WAC01280]